MRPLTWVCLELTSKHLVYHVHHMHPLDADREREREMRLTAGMVDYKSAWMCVFLHCTAWVGVGKHDSVQFSAHECRIHTYNSDIHT